jgi:hypothetical protein
MKFAAAEPTEAAARILLVSLVARGQIKLKRIDGWRGNDRWTHRLSLVGTGIEAIIRHKGATDV